MYSFKYHLVSLCAVFLALAVGMLLGAAVGGSELLSNTTSDMVESLTKQYGGLTEENARLDLSNQQNESLSGAFVDQWQADKLKDRSVLVLAGATGEQDNIARQVSGYVQAAGGKSVTLYVHQPDFGIGDEEVLASLKAVLPEVAGRDYRDVLAEAVVSEWTSPHPAEAAPQADGAAAAPAAPAAAAFDGGRINEPGEMSEADRKACPVTARLVELGIVTVSGSSAIPEGLSGCIDVMVDESVPAAQPPDAAAEGGQGEAAEAAAQASATPTYEADGVCARIGSDLAAKGVPVVFTQETGRSTHLMDEAAARGVAGVSSCSGVMARYSIVRLLVSGGSGVYGPDRDAAFWYPAL